MLALRATWKFLESLLFTTVSRYPMACTHDRAAFAFSGLFAFLPGCAAFGLGR